MEPMKLSFIDLLFLFNTNNGNLYFDTDGIGGIGAVQIATLEGVTSLSTSDFHVEF